MDSSIVELSQKSITFTEHLQPASHRVHKKDQHKLYILTPVHIKGLAHGVSDISSGTVPSVKVLMRHHDLFVNVEAQKEGWVRSMKDPVRQHLNKNTLKPPSYSSPDLYIKD